MAQAQPKDKAFIFAIERTFDAPLGRVWKAWEDPERFKKWMGPKGSAMTRCEIDFRPGGAALYTLEFEGGAMHGRWAYKEIRAQEKIVAIISFMDENHEKIIVHPGMADWPLEILSVVTFTELDGKTKITVEWTARNAADIERRTFEEGADSMTQGWTGAFDQLETFLAGN